MIDVAIIGAGPSGLMCAAQLKNELSVVIFDKNEEIGGKLKVCGGGRCNVTNKKDLNNILNHIPRNNKFLYSTFNNFDNFDLIDFFENNNLKLVEEDNNRMFPETRKSKDVIEVFKKILNSSKNKRVILNYTIDKIEKEEDYFIINESYKAKSVVIATGGYSYQHLGTTGDGYKFAKDFSHNIVDIFPCETPLVSNDEIITSKVLQGVKVDNCDVEIYASKKKLYSVNQDILFTHFGLSGPAALHLSYFVQTNKDKDIYIKLNPVNGYPKRLKKFLNEDGEITISISDVKGFKKAFTTGGGVDLKQINPKGFESKIQDNLYFIGEVLDINAFTGGYNLTICFSEGFSCAKQINQKL